MRERRCDHHGPGLVLPDSSTNDKACPVWALPDPERRRMLNPSRFLDELPEDLYEELRIKRSYGW